MHMILLGPPGAGKGTQSQKVTQAFNLVQLSTGDMLRAAIAAQTSVGLEAKKYMDAGELLPDDVVVKIIADRMKEPDCANGCLFDGFPRTLGQAQKLDELLKSQGAQIDHVIQLVVDPDALIKRITGRWLHAPSGRTYHNEFAPPKVPGKDDVTGEPLTQRSDDNESTVRTRLESYEKQTSPLVGYYSERGILKDVDGMQSPDEVFEDISACVSQVSA